MVNEQEVLEQKTDIQTTEVEQKKNPFLETIASIVYNFKDSFKYNPCKFAGILIALPGFFMGFFLGVHSKILFLNNDFAGLYMFIMVLMGCINVFNGVAVMGKRNLSSILISFICSLAITVVGILWIVAIFTSWKADVILETPYTLNSEHFISMGCVVISILCSLVGCIWAFIKRDKNYKKVVF